MTEAHGLSRTDARRIAVRAQLLGDVEAHSEHLSDVEAVVRRLTALQLDQTRAVAPSAELVLWSRLGSTFDPDDLHDALNERRLVELDGMVRPAEDLRLYRAEMAAWGTGAGKGWQVRVQHWVEANAACRADILEVLRQDGPLPSGDLPDTCHVPWRSSGWNDQRNVARMLDCLAARGEVAVAGREGRERLWDLAERVYPDDPPVPVEEARRIRGTRRLAALGIARARSAETPVEPNDVGEVGEPAVVEGVRGPWRVDPGALRGFEGFRGRVALLSPLDRLVLDRKRMAELFEFDYQLEMYKPVASRRWGYWALPVLAGDRLVGKVDATADRTTGVLGVTAIHEDAPWDRSTRTAVRAEIEDLAHWLGLGLRLP